MMTNLSGCSIIMVEDDDSYAQIVIDLFEWQGFRVLVAATSDEGLKLIIREHPELIILDLHLTRKFEGLTLLRQIREQPGMEHIPIIIHSIWADEQEIRINGLNDGAWYCLDKDDSLPELEALVKSALQIKRRTDARLLNPRRPLDFDSRTGRIWLDGNLVPIRLSHDQALLMDLLVHDAGAICNRDRIARSVYKSANVSNDQIDRLIGRLRDKLRSVTGHTHYIETIHGIGYRVRVDDQ